MAEIQPSQTTLQPGGEPEPGWELVGTPPPGGDLDDHGSALQAATSVVWNGTGERSLDPMGSYHLETYLGELRRTVMTASEIASQFPCGTGPVLLIAKKIRPGLDSGENL